MADTSDVDAALLAYLQADPELAGLLPDGVHWDPGPVGATRLLLVSHVLGTLEYVFDGVLAETILYRIKAVTQGPSGTTVKTAALRIRQLMEFQFFPIDGYEVMDARLVEPIRVPEFDRETNLRWQHRGGVYAVMVRPAPNAAHAA